MKIQYLRRYVEKDKYKILEQNSILQPRVLDDFDINIIGLSDPKIWVSEDSNEIDCLKDLKNIFKLIEERKKSEIIIMCPQNIKYYYDKIGIYRNEKKNVELKSLIPFIGKIVTNGMKEGEIFTFGKTNTIIDQENISSDFYFKDNLNVEVLTESEKSKKKTTVKFNNIIFTTLKLETENEIEKFIKFIFQNTDEERIPEWVQEYNFNNDLELKKNRKKIEEELSKKESEKRENIDLINKNNKYKSILFLSGERLVEIIKEMMEEMLKIDLSDFEDKKKEDLRVEFKDITFIIEIKGVNSSVKSSNISQLDNHVELYNEEGKETKGKGILIINPERTKSIEERNPIHSDQIKKIEKDENLMITTEVFLKLFELFKQNKIKKEKIKSILQTEIGMLTIEKINNLKDQ